jgi:hypothetical protein
LRAIIPCSIIQEASTILSLQNILPQPRISTLEDSPTPLHMKSKINHFKIPNTKTTIFLLLARHPPLDPTKFPIDIDPSLKKFSLDIDYLFQHMRRHFHKRHKEDEDRI